MERQLNLILSAEKQKEIETVVVIDEKPEIASKNYENLAKKEDEKTSKAEKRKQMVDSLLDPNAGPSTKKGRFEGEIYKQLYYYKYIILLCYD